jgi:hypothetical protein
MNRNKTTKERMISTRLDKKNTIRSSMSQKRRIRTRNSEIIKRTRPFDTLDHFMTQRTHQRVTIRYQVLKILSDSGKMQGTLHDK